MNTDTMNSQPRPVAYRNVDLVIRTALGQFQYNADVSDSLPLFLIGETVMEHPQFAPLLDELQLQTSTTIAVHTPGKLQGKLPPGMSIKAGEVTLHEPYRSDVPRVGVPTALREALDRQFTNVSAVFIFGDGE